MSARGWSNYTPESYMRDEEREDDARIAAEWRKAHPGRPNAIKRKWLLWRAVRRERREFRSRLRNYGRHVIPMAEMGNRLIDSWLVLIPLGLMCLWAILHSAGCFK